MTTQKKTIQKKTTQKKAATHNHPLHKQNSITASEIEEHKKSLEESEEYREAFESLRDFLELSKALGIIYRNPFATKETLEHIGRLMGIQLADTSRQFKKLFYTDTPANSVE